MNDKNFTSVYEWELMAVLVTGASGFVGSWLTRRLVESGETVKVLHRPKSDLSQIKDLSYVSCLGDVTDKDSLSRSLEGADTVFHLAGVVGYTPDMRAAMEKVNVGGTQNVVDLLRGRTDVRLVYMSSVVAVGASFDGQPLNEKSPYNVKHLNLGYFETKRRAEEIVLSSCANQELNAVALNPSTIYGAADMLKGSRKVQLKVVQGHLSVYPKGGVSVVSVHDVVEALMAARKRGRSGERYILCGENLLLKELFQKIAHFAGSQAPRWPMPNWVMHALGLAGVISRENAWTAVLYHWFDHSKATIELGFKPRPADQAIQESVQWALENRELWQS